MKPPRKAARFHRRVVTTLGDLIAAAYEAAGPGQERLDRAAQILTRSPLAKAMNRHLEFVKV
jgi:hypothetical protein